MKRDPYRDQANKSRQEINAKKEVEETLELKSGELSRSVLHEKKRNVKAAQKKQFPLRRVLFAAFILLPLTVVALSFFLLKNDENEPTDNREQSVGVEQNDHSEVAGTSDDQIENDDSFEKEQPVTNEEEVVDEPIEDAPEPEPEPEAVEETPVVEETQDSIRTHTVQAGENLYRIAINQVGSADGMEQIKQLNGLPDDEIYEGQELKIPVP